MTVKLRFQFTEAGALGVDGANVPRRVVRGRRLKNENAIVPLQKMAEGRAMDPNNSPVFAIPEVVPVCLHILLIILQFQPQIRGDSVCPLLIKIEGLHCIKNRLRQISYSNVVKTSMSRSGYFFFLL